MKIWRKVNYCIVVRNAKQNFHYINSMSVLQNLKKNYHMVLCAEDLYTPVFITASKIWDPL